MSYKSSPYYSSVQKCEWCYRQTNNVQQGKNCPHAICNKCVMKETKCQSNCPLCWYIDTAEYINVNKICSVCCNGINLSESPFQCHEHHRHCSRCLRNGCILCQFRELKACNDKNYRDLPPDYQHTLYTCQVWQMKFEEIQQLKSNDPASVRYNKEKASWLELGNESQLVSAFPLLEHQQNNDTEDERSGDCMVCLEELGSSYKTLKECGHSFHHVCIDTWFQSNGKHSCPSCGYVYGISKGPQPDNGRMTLKYLPTCLPGFEKEKYGYKESPTIEITYTFPSGIQGPLNPNPNRPYNGTTRKGYLPNNKEGKEILGLLQRAFKDQHIFTIGKSTTTGQDNVITWNDIHHKTSIHGGPEGFGYPDPTYLYRVRQELADKGYK